MRILGVIISIALIRIACGLVLQFLAHPEDSGRSGVFDKFGKDVQQILEKNNGHNVHYSELSEGEHPIDLSQYVGDLVLRVDISQKPETKKALLESKGDIEFKIWANSKTKGYIDVQIDDTNLSKLNKKFQDRGLVLLYSTIISDLPQRIFESYPEGYQRQNKENEEVKTEDSYVHQITQKVVEATQANAFSEIFFEDYRPLETINAWLDIIQQTFPDYVKIEEIGETYEYRTYKVIHFSIPDSDPSHKHRKTIVVTGGVHAREWISVSSVLYLLYAMLSYYNDHPSDYYTQLDFMFIPVTNPDGYAYTWNSDRLWRKNRQETTFPKCFGIDIDHSYDYHFTRSSDWACGEEYSGEAPFEAFESSIWNEYLNRTNENHTIYGFIDLHSYSQEILYPLSYSCTERPRDEENLIELAYGISKAIRLQSGKNYNVLPACVDKDLDLLPDLGAGTALDFMYHNKAFWAYQFKLRDSGNHGFLLPGKYIEPVGKEVFAAMRYFCRFLLEDD